VPAGNTVSKWPTKRKRLGPRPGFSATRWSPKRSWAVHVEDVVGAAVVVHEAREELDLLVPPGVESRDEVASCE
jgi:hypothetical protein